LFPPSSTAMAHGLLLRPPPRGGAIKRLAASDPRPGLLCLSSSSRFPYHYLVSTSLKLPARRSPLGARCAAPTRIPADALSERDGRCVQSLIQLHRDILMHDY